ncbi:FAD-dependent monooxygenase [bacterium RCC_150]
MTDTQPVDEHLEVPVLIVGGGPAGLTTALELARRGIEGLLIERRDFSPRYPRAHLLNVRTMESFHDVGVADEIYRLSPPEDQWHRVAWYTSLGGEGRYDGLKIGHVEAWGGGNDLESYRLASPRPFANLPQIRLDRILWEHARKVWPDRILGSHELVGLEVDGEGALATVRDLIGDRLISIRARYVVAADGGRTVSHLVDNPTVGPRALLDLVNVYFSADLSKIADEEALITYFINPDGQGSFAGALLALGPDSWGARSTEWSAVMAFRLDDVAAHDDAGLIDRARRLVGAEDIPFEVHAISHWQFEGAVAERFRVGPVLIVGDAAHRHPPTGGLGLNTAIGDVSNLAWKLESVLKGWADDALLDSYEAERQPVSARNVAHSLQNAGRHEPVAASLGLHNGISHEDGWAAIAAWADSPAGSAVRRVTAEAVAANAEDFSQLNIEAGFSYEHGALRPDGTPPVPGQESAQDFVPSARPGRHLPHVWLESDGKPVSTSDLVAPSGFTAFVDDKALAWREALSVVAQEFEMPLTVVVIGGQDGLSDPAGSWREAADVSIEGLVLVRPDRHVAWRSHGAPADEAASELHDLIAGLTRGEFDRPDPEQTLRQLAEIAEAGERLRTGHVREAKLFEELARASTLKSRS